jgi:hypothetical protein
MISSEATLAIREVARALTDDAQMEKIFSFCGISENAMPESFEMLFSVRIAPSNIEHETGEPEILGFRKY